MKQDMCDMNSTKLAKSNILDRNSVYQEIGLGEGLAQFHSYSSLHHIIFKKTCPLKFSKILWLYTDINGSKSSGKS